MSILRSPQQDMPVRISLEPVYNALNSFSLLNAAERVRGLNTWVVQTAAALSPEQRHTNRLVFEGMREALAPEQDVPDFPTYLNNFVQQDPIIVRNRVLEGLRSHYSRRVPSEAQSASPDVARLLDDVQAYLTCVEYVRIEASFDPALQAEVHRLLNNAPAMHQMIVSHLEQMWKANFAAEWKRVQGSLSWQVEMFTHNFDNEAALAEIFHTFTGRELPADAAGQVSDASEIILVPSWHTGRHVTLWQGDALVRLFFSEPPNYDIAGLNATPVGRAELRARLAALADETRLRIIELLVQQDEMHAQDIIAALELSQSSVSRHLKQLVAPGYLYERRGEGANKTYRLSSFYFERTARALNRLLSGEDILGAQGTQDQEVPFAQELKRFVDRRGRLTMWPPARQRDKLLVLEYLASKFEPGRLYSEKEVNDLLLLNATIKDYAVLRRALYEYRFLNRKRDGSLYWLVGSDGPEEEEPDPTPPRNWSREWGE